MVLRMGSSDEEKNVTGSASAAATALVIGGTRGIGRATAVGLAARGHRVGVVGRDPAAGEATVRAIRQVGGDGIFLPADVSSMRQVVALAALVREQLGAVSVLVHSADVLRRRRVDSVDGIEVSFAINYLSRFLLNRLLEPDLLAGAPARIVHVAAAGFPGALNVGHVPPPADMSSFAGHSVGQRANDVYTVELAGRLAGTGVTITTINPGSVDTDIRRTSPDGGRLLTVMAALSRPWTTTAEAFAAQVLRLAVAEDLAGVSGALFNRKGRPITARSSVTDTDRGGLLWQRSEDLVRPFLPADTTHVPS